MNQTQTMSTKQVKARLEYLRRELRAERISYGELNELQALAEHIPADDVELRQAAGLPERRLVVISSVSNGKRWFLRQCGPNSAFWGNSEAKATRFDLAKMDKAAVSHFEKHLHCQISLIPV